MINNLSYIISKDNGPRGHSTSRAPEQVSGPVRVRPSVKQEGHEYYQARSAKVPNPVKLSNSISLTYDYWHVQIIGKFKINIDHFTDKDTRIYYIFNTINRDT